MPSELGEQLHLDRAQEGLRGPEAETNLHDLIRCRIFTHVSPSSVVEATPLSINGHIMSEQCAIDHRLEGLASTTHAALCTGVAASTLNADCAFLGARH